MTSLEWVKVESIFVTVYAQGRRAIHQGRRGVASRILNALTCAPQPLAQYRQSSMLVVGECS